MLAVYVWRFLDLTAGAWQATKDEYAQVRDEYAQVCDEYRTQR